MCTTCGCSEGAKATIYNLETGQVSLVSSAASIEKDLLHAHRHAHQHSHGDIAHTHEHGHEHMHSHCHDAHSHDHIHDDFHAHDHQHSHAHGVIDLQQSILQKNDALAARNRAWLEGREVLMLNLVSSPGSGKTSLLERTILDLKGKLPIAVIEGDQETANDAQRIAATGVNAIQVNTGTGCHLEADMIERGLAELKPKPCSVVMVENVGNLVCPALFDLGERAKVAILSVTEGEDKPLKYPHMFRAASLLLLNKIDLLPHLDFDVAKVIENARTINPEVEVLQVSAKTGAGMDVWYTWLSRHLDSMHL